MKKIVILSGGIDSTTLLYDVVDQFKSENVIALTFFYGSKHNKQEIAKATETCIKLNVKHQVIDLSVIFDNFNSALLNNGGEEIPQGHYEKNNMKKTVVPYRNGILLSIATGFAEQFECDAVYYGAHAGDHSIYPDCRDTFVKAMSLASTLGTYNRVKIEASYENIDKFGILKIGERLGIDYSSTWTCYEGNIVPCGKCGSCVERSEAFVKHGKKDPLFTNEQWEDVLDNLKKLNIINDTMYQQSLNL